jgi:succinylarginine dihydrolase
MAVTHEVNFDGLVGPTHNFAGLSHGNVASMKHRGLVSRPREAALQGLAKMKALSDLGLKQALLPPHERPSIATLRAFGFSGTDAAVLKAAQDQAPSLLVACSSASNMWVANAATVVPSRDSADHRLHFTPANLVSKLHRSIEPAQTVRTLRAIFADEAHFAVHEPVPGAQGMGDEGAANHTRFAVSHGEPGLHFFVYGHSALNPKRVPKRFTSRQALEASEAVARQSLLGDEQCVFVQQNPAAIDAGVFHNDVIAVGNENLLFYHEQAFVNSAQVIRELRKRLPELIALKVPAKRVPMAAAVKSYLFNSQLITLVPGHMALIAPADCREMPEVHEFLQEVIAKGQTPLREMHFFDLKQSMRNGGGPACLRLRVVMTDRELAAIPQGLLITDPSHARLVAWVKKHYRETLTHAELADPSLLRESRRALDELTKLLGLGSIYPFQQ